VLIPYGTLLPQLAVVLAYPAVGGRGRWPHPQMFELADTLQGEWRTCRANRPACRVITMRTQRQDRAFTVCGESGY
jgi:hypothetical protein